MWDTKAWGYIQTKLVKPLYEHPYLVVYGRDSCGYTRNTIKKLSEAGIKFEYMNVNDRSVTDSLNLRMESMGIDTRYYFLPVVDLNNSISIRPDNRQLIESAKALSL